MEFCCTYYLFCYVSISELSGKFEWKEYPIIGKTGASVTLSGEVLNASELLIVVEEAQLPMEISPLFAHNNGISANSSSYGSQTYWVRLNAHYNISTNVLSVYFGDWQGERNDVDFHVFYR